MIASKTTASARDQTPRADGGDGSIWHIITGEYPPEPGGVADYTYFVAGELSRRGQLVHVWTVPPREDATTAEIPGVVVHRIADCWSREGLRRLDRELDVFPAPRRLLVQYSPFTWGRRGLNVGFGRWVARRHKDGDIVDVMFHEVAYPFQFLANPLHWFLAAVQHGMARRIVKGSDRVLISIPGWEPLLRRLGLSKDRAAHWLPIPSNVAETADPARVAELKARLAPRGEAIVGHFGTFGGLIATMLEKTLPAILEGRNDRVGLLLGRGGRRFADELVARRPSLADRLVATGGLATEDLSNHLAACDLMFQPFPDGVSSRRTSLMAPLSHGLPIVTTLGRLSEPFWRETAAVAPAPAGDAPALIATVETLLADPAARAELGAKARALYQERFALERTVDRLLEKA